jgi:lipoprotein-releasing system permease protein
VRGEASRSLSLSGIEPESYTRVVPLHEKIVRGSMRLGAGDILIGTELALDLGLGLGDRLRVAAANGNALDLTVTGIFDMGNKGANLRTAFVALRTAQGLMAFAGQVSAIDLTVQDVYAADITAMGVAAAHGVQADSWIRTNQEFFTAVRAQTAANTAIRFFVGLSVAFGIASVLVVSVVQRSREIGILRAMGISRMQVLRLFLLQGGLLALAGSIAGLLLGGGALLVWHALQRNTDGTPLFPLVVEPLMFAVTLVLATLTGLIAALAPSLRAARLDPVEAIRG